MANPYKNKLYTVTQKFGKTEFSSESALTWQGVYYERFHCGIDLTAGYQSPIYSTTEGEMIFAKGIDRDGARYAITHRDDLYFAYWHLDGIQAPSVGTKMQVGTLLGYEGSSGNSSGSHLHYEVQQKIDYGASLHNPNNPIDPTPYLEDAQGGADDMNPRLLVESLYDLLVGSRPSEAVLAAKAQYVADNGPQQVIKDLIDAGSRYMSQRRALSTYQQARIDAGSRYPDGSIYEADTFADDRLNGGGSFQSVMQGDLAYYLAQDRHLQDLLSKDTPAPLSPDDQQDLAFGKKLRSYLKGLK